MRDAVPSSRECKLSDAAAVVQLPTASRGWLRGHRPPYLHEAHLSELLSRELLSLGSAGERLGLGGLQRPRLQAQGLGGVEEFLLMPRATREVAYERNTLSPGPSCLRQHRFDGLGQSRSDVIRPVGVDAIAANHNLGVFSLEVEPTKLSRLSSIAPRQSGCSSTARTAQRLLNGSHAMWQVRGQEGARSQRSNYLRQKACARAKLQHGSPLQDAGVRTEVHAQHAGGSPSGLTCRIGQAWKPAWASMA
mmetsp:Transcript_25044/g.54614  ORF Transcript_25044/g.54614 Transcript_25044/m.54614 type:complete len:249 (-) Transcript_25044:58-804(-)